jgi:hypothetical protein
MISAVRPGASFCKNLQEQVGEDVGLVQSAMPRASGVVQPIAFPCLPTCRGAWPLHIKCCLSVLGEAVSGNKLAITNRSRA